MPINSTKSVYKNIIVRESLELDALAVKQFIKINTDKQIQIDRQAQEQETGKGSGNWQPTQ